MYLKLGFSLFPGLQGSVVAPCKSGSLELMFLSPGSDYVLCGLFPGVQEQQHHSGRDCSETLVLCGLHVAVFSKNNVDSEFERECLASLILLCRVLLASKSLRTGRATLWGKHLACWIFFLDLAVLNLAVKPNVYCSGCCCCGIFKHLVSSFL